MAFTLVQQTPEYYASGAGDSFSIGGVDWGANNTLNNLIVLVVVVYRNSGTSSWADGTVTDGVNTYKMDVDILPGNIGIGIWSCIESAGGAKRTLTWNPNDSCGYSFDAFAMEFSGVDTASRQDGSNTGSGSGANASFNVTAGGAGDLIIGAFSWDNSADMVALSQGASYSLIVANKTYSWWADLMEYNLSSSAGVQVVNCVSDAYTWRGLACCYKAAGGAGGGMWLTRTKNS